METKSTVLSMTNYDKGSRGERELIEILEEQYGFVCMRAPASGAGTKRELPDVIAGDGENFYVMEVKRWDRDVDYEYLTKDEVNDLAYFAKMFGAEYYVAVRFDYGEWGFFKKDELRETKKSYRVDEFKKPERGVDCICK